MTILLPHGEVDSRTSKLAPRPSSLAGVRVGFIDNVLWRSMHFACDELAKVLTSEYGVEGTETVYIPPDKGGNPKEYHEQLDNLRQRVEVVISGLGN